MRFSIIIVAYKDYDSLNRCIEFVKKREQQDYEIIIRDNTNDNVGFAAGCNLGAKEAKGEILVFLNPDTEPNGDWLDRMAAGFDKGFDAIGPTSDYVAGMQQAIRYLDDPRDFVETKLLIGFCLMIKASTYRELGGMDEGCFLGCDDLDISWRLGLVGKRLGICADVFVHHVGHTSMVLNSDKDQLIKESETYFRSKLKVYYDTHDFGRRVPSSEELWGCKILATELRPQTLSVAIIYRDAVEDLKVLVPSLKFADQIVLVDTDPNRSDDKLSAPYWEGSVYDLIGSYAEVKGYCFPWVDDFASARNFALSKCTSDWVLWLDADDRLDTDQIALITALLKNPGNHTALQDCHFGFQVHNTDYYGNTMDIFSQSRLFPRLLGIKWAGLNGCHGYVHETIWESAEAAGLQFVPTNIILKHTGYSDPEVMKQKQVRNLRLLKKEPENCFSLYNIGQSYASVGDFEQAETYYQKALNISKSHGVQFYDHICYCIAICLTQLGRNPEANRYLEGNSKPDAMQMLGSLKILYGTAEEVSEGCDLLFKYLKLGPIQDILGTNYLTLRKASVKMLTDIGVLA